VVVVKCLDCGNTFKISESLPEGEMVRCPICEADYVVVIKDGKLTLKESVYETEDPGEL